MRKTNFQDQVPSKKQVTEGSIFGKTELGPLKICFFHKSNKISGRDVKVNFFRTLEINQRIATIQGVSIQEKKWLAL